MEKVFPNITDEVSLYISIKDQIQQLMEMRYKDKYPVFSFTSEEGIFLARSIFEHELAKKLILYESAGLNFETSQELYANPVTQTVELRSDVEVIDVLAENDEFFKSIRNHPNQKYSSTNESAQQSTSQAPEDCAKDYTELGLEQQ